ncbi:MULTISPECIES: hypothetical protein [unclassified Methanoregula]|uniref:hypothetical protein n=1 Tax=unclassified Methanoregula TaxID=2649730 RepID=UPI0009C9D698|nr:MULTISPECIES: hypothetical protein [unclassified Methanoregula]OPX62593.1 MAG: hypothetical protein A4E33_02221 [Methanoregula sp. PtaB.Bin085]OPY36811.1 MAG: hypothetical protein A4E34_00154 [Methanoregula sp. PtaU1.Bin006]
MHTPGTFVVVLTLLVLVLAAGCTSEDDGGLSATPTMVPLPPTTVTTIPVTEPPTPVVTTPTPTQTTEPVQKLPAERQVNLLLTKDRPTSEIHLLFQGGPGEIYVTRIIMRVYTSDVAYQEYIMSKGSKPIPGDEIVAPGTRSGDRCEVFVISAGSRYKVIDERVYGGMYY